MWLDKDMSHADLVRHIHTNNTVRVAADIFADAGRAGRRAADAARASHNTAGAGGLLGVYRDARDAYLRAAVAA